MRVAYRSYVRGATHGMCALHALQVPALSIFQTSLRRGKFDESRKLSDGSQLEFAHIYPMDAVYDTPDDVPQEVGGDWGRRAWQWGMQDSQER